MNWRRSLCITAVAGLSLALPAGTASADFGTKIDPAVTVATGPSPCAGYVRALYDPKRKFHGRQVVWLRAELGLLPGSSSGCVTNVTLTWRNIDTGETGGNAGPMAMRDGSQWAPCYLGRHPGHYQILIATDLPHVAGSGEITVPR